MEHLIKASQQATSNTLKVLQKYEMKICHKIYFSSLFLFLSTVEEEEEEEEEEDEEEGKYLVMDCEDGVYFLT